MKKVLIVSYNFPPKSGISSRRWVKLAKYLEREGIECFVITRDGGKEFGVNWTDDLKFLNPKRIFTIRNVYPRFLETPVSSIKYRILKFIGIRVSKYFGFKYDSAEFFYRKWLSKAQKIIDSGVNNLIVSGPPHSLFFQATILKSENPFLNLILDYRDSWNDETQYSFIHGKLNFQRKIHSINYENLALLHANHVLFVTNDMKNRIANIYDDYKNKFQAFYNFYDKEDYDCSEFNNSQIKHLDIIYIGTLGKGRRKAIEIIAETIDQIQSEGILINSKFHFYTNEFLLLFKSSPYFHVMKKFFVFHPIVPSNRIGQVISKYGFCLSVNAENYPHAFGTKIFDYMALNKKIIHISNGGELYDLLDSKGHLVAKYSTVDVKNILLRINKDEIHPNFDQFKQFDIKNSVDKLKKILV